MTLLRVGMFGRVLLSRGSAAPITRSIIRSSKIAITIPQRQFIATPAQLVDSVPEGSSFAPQVPNLKKERSIVIRPLSRIVPAPQVKAALERCGIKMTNFSMLMDKFGFHNTSAAFVELPSEQQAQDAIAEYNRKQPLEKSLAAPMLVDRVLPKVHKEFSYRLVEASEAGVATAIQPIVEGRRCVFAVVPPGWADLKAKVRDRNDYNRAVVERALRPFGLETIGKIVVNWGDKKQTPRFLCHVDFETTEGADKAIRAIHDTEVEGIKVWLEKSKVMPWTAYRIGVFGKKSLELLQAKGLAPSQEELAKEDYSQPNRPSRFRQQSKKA